MSIGNKRIFSNNDIFIIKLKYMPAKTIKEPQIKILNGNFNGQYSIKTKNELIQEIVELKEKIITYENLFNKQKQKKNECMVELNQLLNKK